MNGFKKWFKSVTIWGGLGSIATGIYLITIKDVPTGITSIVAGITTIVGRKKATNKII